MTPLLTLNNYSQKPSDLQVVLGTNSLLLNDTDAQVYGVEKFIRHPSPGVKNDKVPDIALIRLDRDVEYVVDHNKRFTVNSVCLPNNKYRLKSGRNVSVSGFGSVKLRDRTIKMDIDKDIKTYKTLTLRDTELMVVDYDQCRQLFDRAIADHNNTKVRRGIMMAFNETFNNDNYYCMSRSLADKPDYTFAQMIYSGDSGSSVIDVVGRRAHSIGIVSSGFFSEFRILTTSATKVGNYIQWIEEIIEQKDETDE